MERSGLSHRRDSDVDRDAQPEPQEAGRNAFEHAEKHRRILNMKRPVGQKKMIHNSLAGYLTLLGILRVVPGSQIHPRRHCCRR